MKKKQKSKGSIKTLILPLSVLIFFLSLGFLIALLSKNRITLILSMVVALPLAFYFSNQENKKVIENEEGYNLLSFYWSFYHYSCLLNSYLDGFKKAVDNLEQSHLKDDLSDFLESESNNPPLLFLNTRKENDLIEEVTRLYSLKEYDGVELSALKKYISLYENELKNSF